MSRIEIELDAYVLPDGHRVFKLFPGSSYRYSKEVLDKAAAFLDVKGLEALDSDRAGWTDAKVLEIIRSDRSLRNANSTSKPRSSSQDTKRLRFLLNLMFEAEKGDLIVVPLGKGLDGDVAIGQFSTEKGALSKLTIDQDWDKFETWSRPIEWLRTVKRRRFGVSLNKSLHAPTAFHLIEGSSREEVYLAAYGSFTYDDIYVASFPSEKETLTAADQAIVGLWFNSLAVIHDDVAQGSPIDDGATILELGIEPSSVELELIRNSPWTAVLRTVGPLAFSALAIYPLAVEGRPLSDLKDAEVSAKPVARAADKCAIIIPPDMVEIAKGYGHGRWDQHCRLGKKVRTRTTLKAQGRLKSAPKATK